MIIRNEVLKTLKASPLNSRSVRRTCGQIATVESTLNECPNSAVGRPLFPTFGRLPVAFQGRCGVIVISGGATHHPAIERRRSFPTFRRLPVAFQRHYHVFADNHLKTPQRTIF